MTFAQRLNGALLLRVDVRVRPTRHTTQPQRERLIATSVHHYRQHLVENADSAAHDLVVCPAIVLPPACEGLETAKSCQQQPPYGLEMDFSGQCP